MDRPDGLPLSVVIKNILDNNGLEGDDDDHPEDIWEDSDYDLEDHDVIDIDDAAEMPGVFFDDDAPLVVPEEVRAARAAQRDYVNRYEPGSADQQLAVLLAHLGLTDASPEELGLNHPGRMREKPPSATQTERGASQSGVYYSPIVKGADGDGDGQHQNIIAEARWARVYMEGRRLSAKAAASDLGYSLDKFYRLLALTRLPKEVQSYLEEGRLRYGHCRAIAKMRDPAAAARLIMRHGLSVRQAETMARRLRAFTVDGRLEDETAIPKAWEVEDFIADALGLKVEFKDRAGRGKITIHYNSPQQAQKVIDQLTASYFGAH